jgi:anti-sigma factor RsiW
MNDCTNAEIRDQLPDLLHERLDDAARAVVIAHVADCIDCRDELRLLGEVRAAIEARTPRVDLAYVIGALPKPLRAEVARIAPPRRVWTDWRVAAAVTLLVAGGSSVALLGRGGATTDSVRSPTVSTAPVASVPAGSAARANPANETASAEPTTGAGPVAEPAIAEPAVAAVDPQPAATDVGSDASLSNLDETQLKALLQDLDNLPAVPVADPAPVSLRINARTSGDL